MTIIQIIAFNFLSGIIILFLTEKFIYLLLNKELKILKWVNKAPNVIWSFIAIQLWFVLIVYYIVSFIKFKKAL